MSNMDLSVKITGDARSLNSELQRTASSIRGVMTNIAGAFGIGITAGALVSSVRGAMQYAAALNDAADQLGLTVRQQQALNEAGFQFAANQQQISAGMNQLVAARAAAIDGNETMIRSFERLGIAIYELPYLSTVEIMERMGSSLLGVNSASVEYNSALQIMGRRATTLIPMLRAIGEDGLKPFEESLINSGRLLDEQFVARLDRADKAIQKLGQRFRVFISGYGESIENIFGTTGENSFDKRVEQLMAQRKNDFVPSIRRPYWNSYMERGDARSDVRKEMEAEKLIEQQNNQLLQQQQIEAAKIAEQERLAAEHKQHLLDLTNEAASVEEQIRWSRLSDEEKLLEMEREMQRLVAQRNANSDPERELQLRKEIAELELRAGPLRTAVDTRRENDLLGARRDSERAAEQQSRDASDLARIKSGSGTSGGAPVAADQMAAIGAYVGAQTNLYQSVMERQLKVQEQMRDFLARMASREQGGFVTA